MQIDNLILNYILCYLVFSITSFLGKSSGGYRLFDKEGAVRNAGSLQVLQIAGIFWFGVIPYYISGQSFSKIVFGQEVPGTIAVLPLFLLAGTVILIAFIQSKKLFNAILSKQIAVKLFSSAFVFRYILVRCLFLFSYEIFFRGYLLMECIQHWGVVYAVIINIILYSLLHVFAGKKEMFACIPFGLLLCTICIWLKAIWPAIALHLSLSLVYEMNLVWKFSKPLKSIL
jgi:membrane protease YdiL (CAAX protease family)